MVIPDIVVVGGSAGGVEALSALFWDMPPRTSIAFFVTLHVLPHSRSFLPSILARTARLPAEHPRDGETIRPGRIYVAPPDFHLIVCRGIVHLSNGPNEHHVRPAIDSLFRSAAQAYGQRVIGVLLSGNLDDGVEGLREIKRHGGLTIVQEPAEAGFPAMPRNALAAMEIDYCLPVTQIRHLMTRSSEAPKIPITKNLAARTKVVTPSARGAHFLDSRQSRCVGQAIAIRQSSHTKSNTRLWASSRVWQSEIGEQQG